MTVISSPRRSLRTGFEPRSGTRGENQGFRQVILSRRWTTVVPEVLRSFYVAGDLGDRRRLPDYGDRKATPPDHIAARGRH